MTALRLGLCVLLAIAACKTGATAGGTVTPDGDTPDEGADPMGQDEKEDAAALQKRLHRLSDEHERASSNANGFGACEDLCDLAAQICKVKESLCELADRYPADDSYQALCREATHECREANQSCVRCAQGGGGATEAEPETK